jgi:hypothetical protein
MQSSDSVILEYKYKSITDIIFEREKKGEVSSRTNKVKMSAY